MKEAAGSGKHVRFLLVDDQPLFLDALKAVLAIRGEYEVVGETDDAERGVQLAEELGPDVVLMDLTLPGLGGLEATRQIKARHPEITVLILSGYTDAGSRKRALAAGASGLFDKAKGVDGLLAAIAAAVA